MSREGRCIYLCVCVCVCVCVFTDIKNCTSDGKKWGWGKAESHSLVVLIFSRSSAPFSSSATHMGFNEHTGVNESNFYGSLLIILPDGRGHVFMPF